MPTLFWFRRDLRMDDNPALAAAVEAFDRIIPLYIHDHLPNDPWGNPYQYTNPGTKAEVDVFSYGADKKPGGTGTDADIGI